MGKNLPFKKSLVDHLTKPSLRLRLSKGQGDKEYSRIGGRPLAPEDFEWPRKASNFPLQFLCRLNLKETAAFEVSKDLPDFGHLLFFYDAKVQPWGFDPDDQLGWRVIWSPGDRQLQAAQYPDENFNDELQPETIKIRFAEELSYPDPDSRECDTLSHLDEQFDLYSEWYAEKANSNPPIHRLFGHPYLHQGDVWREQCQQASHGIYYGGGKLSGGADDH